LRDECLTGSRLEYSLRSAHDRTSSPAIGLLGWM
jgi:hypothetical protein